MNFIDLLIPPAYAQAAGAAQGNMLQAMVIPVLIVVAFYFLLIRPQSKKAKEHRDMVGKLAAGDEVVTTGGILGRITEAGETFVTLEIAADVAIRVQRFQVSQLMPKGTYKAA